jgi:hypothetical protein
MLHKCKPEEKSKLTSTRAKCVSFIVTDELAGEREDGNETGAERSSFFFRQHQTLTRNWLVRRLRIVRH